MIHHLVSSYYDEQGGECIMEMKKVLKFYPLFFYFLFSGLFQHQKKLLHWGFPYLSFTLSCVGVNSNGYIIGEDEKLNP